MTNEQEKLHATPGNEDAPIVNQPMTNSHLNEQTEPITEPSSIDKASTEAQHGSIGSDIQNEYKTDKVIFHDANTF